MSVVKIVRNAIIQLHQTDINDFDNEAKETASRALLNQLCYILDQMSPTLEKDNLSIDDLTKSLFKQLFNDVLPSEMKHGLYRQYALLHLEIESMLISKAYKLLAEIYAKLSLKQDDGFSASKETLFGNAKTTQTNTVTTKNAANLSDSASNKPASIHSFRAIN